MSDPMNPEAIECESEHLRSMAKAIKYAALAVLASSSAEAFIGSAFTGPACTGMTPNLRSAAVYTRSTKSLGPNMELVLVTGARLFSSLYKRYTPLLSPESDWHLGVGFQSWHWKGDRS